MAKQAADIVLTDDNFATIRNAIEEGREIYENIKKTVIFLLSSNFGEIMTMFFAILFFAASPAQGKPHPLDQPDHGFSAGTGTGDGCVRRNGADGKGAAKTGREPVCPRRRDLHVFYGFLIALISLTAFLVVPTALLVGAEDRLHLPGSEKCWKIP